MSGTTDLLDTTAAGGTAVRGAALRVAGFAVGTLASVASAAALFRALGVVDSGRYVLLTSLAAITVGLTDAGLSAIGVREVVVRDPSQRDRILRSLMGLRIVLSALGITLACGYTLAAGLGGALILGAAAVGGAALVQSVQVAYATVLMANLRLGAVTAADLVRQLATTGGIFILAAAGAGLLLFCGNLVVAAAIALVVTSSLAGATLPRRPTFDRTLWSELLRKALPYALATAVATVYLRIGVLFVDQLSTSQQTGYFGVSFRILEVLVVVPQLVVQAGFPILARAARDDAARLRYGIGRMLIVCVLFGSLLALVLGVGAPAIVDVLGGDQFKPAAGVLRWHAVALLASFAAATAGHGLLALGRGRAVLAQALVALVVAVAASVVLTELDGARGAAMAAALAEIALGAAGWTLLARGADGVRPPIAELPRIAMATALGVLPAFVLPAAGAAVAGAGVFLAAALVLRAVPAELIEEARAMARAVGRRRPDPGRP